jgi:copper(I)-binding protein
MKPVDAVVIAPNGRLELKPGGYHLMLSGLKRPLREGERFAAALVFEKAGRVAVTFTVRGMGAEMHHHP